MHREPLGFRESAVYLLIGAGSLLMITYLPHMFLAGIVEDDTKVMLQIGAGVVWFFILAALGWDIVRRRRM